MADKLYLTCIDEVFEGDTFFPEVDFTAWHEVFKSSHVMQMPQTLKYQHVILEKNKQSPY
jgi:dihydrofolate reductase